ncbi:MAG: hypothetical protein QOD35_3360 [Nocardioidaceae bacterium]|nr:hypothetical protein [Nocardioidaceae bacterium]
MTVASGDGLALTLSSTGSVSSLKIGGREVAGGTAPLFSVRKVGGTPNLLPNPGFETDANRNDIPDHWRLMSGTVRPRWVSDQAHTGTRSIRFHSPSIGTSTTLQTTVAVRPDTYYTAGSWIRSRNVKPAAATAEPETGPSPVRLKIKQFDGSTAVKTDQAYGYTDTVGWYRKFVGFKTQPNVTSVRVFAQIVHGSGTVWFDDLQVNKLYRPAWGTGSGTVTGTGARATFDGAANDMNIDATIASHPDDLRIDGIVSSPTNTTTPFQLRVTLPLNAAGWDWWDDPRHKRDITSAGRYENLTQWNVQQTSRYPFNTVSDAHSALTVGIPLDEPKLARARYANGRLTFTFDLGVSPATSIFGGAKVPFSLVLYRSDPAWGYRAAIEKYYQLFPNDFERHTQVAREGGWFGQVDRSRLDTTYDDFGLGLNMIALGTGNDGGDADWGTDFLPWDNARGIYTTAYNHHWGYKHPNVDDPDTPTYAKEIERIKADAAMTPATYEDRRRRDRSIATLNSGARDNNNRLLYARYQGFMQHYENLYPLNGPLDWRTVSRIYQMDPALADADRVGATLDALHLDSVSGMRRWGAADDYYQPHWANASYGLTFSYDSGRVVDRLAFGVASQVQYVSNYAHSHGMFLSANFNASDARSAAWFGAAAIDYFGLERGLPEKVSGQNDPYSSVDGYALFKRTLADQRPISTIDADCDSHTTADLAERFQQTMLYGIYMGCGGTTSWSEDERSVFAKYTPLLREIDAAGWEVVTRARSSNPDVWVERFGSLSDDGGVWLPVHNPTDTPQAYTMTVEGSVVGGLPASDLQGEDRITGTPVVVTPSGNGSDVSFAGTLQPHTTALVRLQQITP